MSCGKTTTSRQAVRNTRTAVKATRKATPTGKAVATRKAAKKKVPHSKTPGGKNGQYLPAQIAYYNYLKKTYPFASTTASSAAAAAHQTACVKKTRKAAISVKKGWLRFYSSGIIRDGRRLSGEHR